MKRFRRLLFRLMSGALRRSCSAGAGALVMHLAAGQAWAQRPGRLPGDGEGWLPWAVAAGIMVVIGIAGFLNPKRSHLG